MQKPIGEATVTTLKGSVPVCALGRTLIHEHVFCRVPNKYLPIALDYLDRQLDQLVDNGFDTIVDVTPYVLPDLYLERLRAKRINIVCCAGFYLPRRVPHQYHRYSVEQLVGVLSYKVEFGIGRHHVLPGMLKAASSGRNITPIERRLITAAGVVQAQSGLPLQTHACRGGRKQLEILLEVGADPTKIVLCHLEMELKGRDPTELSTLINDIDWILDQGANLFFGDFAVSDSKYRRSVLELVRHIKKRKRLDQLFIGTDSHWSVRRSGVRVRGAIASGERNRTYSYLSEHTVPLLLQNGLIGSEIDKMVVANPAKLLFAST